MTNHHVHEALAHQREHDIRLHPHTPRPSRDRDWSAIAPVLSVVAGFLGLVALAAPSL